MGSALGQHTVDIDAADSHKTWQVRVVAPQTVRQSGRRDKGYPGFPVQGPVIRGPCVPGPGALLACKYRRATIYRVRVLFVGALWPEMSGDDAGASTPPLERAAPSSTDAPSPAYHKVSPPLPPLSTAEVSLERAVVAAAVSRLADRTAGWLLEQCIAAVDAELAAAARARADVVAAKKATKAALARGVVLAARVVGAYERPSSSSSSSEEEAEEVPARPPPTLEARRPWRPRTAFGAATG